MQYMNEQEQADLLRAYRKERNANKKERLLAMCQMMINGHSVDETAKQMFQTRETIKDWLERFEQEGSRGLEDSI